MTTRRQDLRDLVAAAEIARQELDKAHRLADTTLALAAALAQGALEGMDASGVEDPVQYPVADLPPPCDHRRAHRPGLPARIDADAELRAFILARIDALTFPQLEAEVAKAFPPARRIGKSAIHAWWQKRRDTRAAKSHPR